ncbi:MAG: hypothetical protein FWE16_03340 [Firmicutes bacterium]|nr:hypothetical protein [Bacillota bacterium]
MNSIAKLGYFIGDKIALGVHSIGTKVMLHQLQKDIRDGRVGEDVIKQITTFDNESVINALMQSRVPTSDDLEISRTDQIDYGASHFRGDDLNWELINQRVQNGEDVSNLTATRFWMRYPSYVVGWFSSFPTEKAGEGEAVPCKTIEIGKDGNIVTMLDDELARAQKWIDGNQFSSRNTLGELGRDDLRRAQKALYGMMAREYKNIKNIDKNNDKEVVQ